MTSSAPISSKIKLSGAAKQMDEDARKLRRMGSIKEIDV